MATCVVSMIILGGMNIQRERMGKFGFNLFMVAILTWLASPGAWAARPASASALANGGMVSAAHPLAAAAGLDALRRGGSAVDAAIAVQAMLAVVEPHESGFLGGGFLLHRNGETGELQFYDGRETAPAAAHAERFMVAGRWQLPFVTTVVSGRSVGVPGLLAMLHQAHEDHGRLAWDTLFEGAAAAAEQGVALPSRLDRQLRNDPSLWLFRDMRRQFLRPARRQPAMLRNEPLATWLRRAAEEGPAALYEGPTAERLVQAVQGRWWLAGDLALEDLRRYEVVIREPICGHYRDWTLCGPPPPSSGGLAILQALAILEPFELHAREPDSAGTVHLIAEASRLAFADRQRYLGDPDHVQVPVAELLDPDYLALRSGLIRHDRARALAEPGAPGVTPQIEDAAPVIEDPELGTTHFTIVDRCGNVVALTSSIEAPFGARFMVDGLLVNSQLTDFDFDPLLDGAPAANAVAPGKRPRSSMSPFLVFDGDGELRYAIGSRGGSRIIGYVLKTLLGVLDWDLTLQEAVALPSVLHRGERLELEAGTLLESLAPELEALGHRVDIRRLESGLHGIERTAGGWRGAADPRMDGVALPE